ncbi:outer membrane protein assembly factor BamA [Desulfobulbus elongatus]|uniref:outer membrane protein assembly factor BamA n=1 Tax=Desulfobulbus elongatus TaxID=53332 RepID=UPI00048673AF|nr:outer membrane protein assembly factor BamA [Desulfobulbus elongatus]
MMSTSRILRPHSTLALLFCALLLGVLAGPADSLARGQHAIFLPFKINAPDTATVTGPADKALEREATAKGMRMMPRSQAEKLVDYKGAWPPPAAALTRVAESAGADYVVIGSLNKLGNRISVDCAIVDVLAPKAPYSAFREADSLDGLGTVTGEIVGTMLAYADRGATVASVAPEGNERIDAGAILQKISTKPGDLYDPATLRQDLKAVFAMGYFDNVEIDAKDSEGGKVVIFRVREKPLIGKVVITGASEISEEDVRDAANIAANSILNPTKVNEAVQKIQELYKSKGYYNTEVGATINAPEHANAEVVFDIKEGEKITIEHIGFTGNKTFSEGELTDVIQTSTHKWWLSWLTDAGVLKMDILRQDAERVAAFYQNNGFLEAKVGEPVVEQKEEALFITFPVDEGPRYRVGTIDIDGDLVKEKDALLTELKIRDEEYLNRQVLRDDITRLTDLYSEQGYAFAEINPKMNKSGSDVIDVVLHVDKGAVAYVNRVEIQGNTRTRDNVIRRDLKVEEGGRFDSKAIRTSTQKLKRLDFFEDVTVTPKPTMVEDQMDVVVDVKEKSTGSFQIGAGYSSSENVLFMGEIAENNLFGTGNRLSLAAATSSESTRYNLKFTNPRLYDSQVSGSIELFNWEREYDDFTKDSTGATFRLGHPLWEEWRIYYAYTISDTDLSDIDTANINSAIYESKDINILSMPEITLVRDTRDKLFSPTKGSRNTIGVSYAGGPFGGDAEFTKVEGSSAWYFPMFWSTVFHVKAAAGQAFENEDGKLPVYERFFLGGMNSIRGFESASVSPRDQYGDKIGGDKMWYGTVSIIFPLVKDMGIDGEIFHDFGNVYDIDEDWDFDDYKKTAGVGIMWASPLGPIRLAWGFNLDKQDDEDSSNWDFSMGGTF